MRRIFCNVLGGLILVIGWEVNIDQVGFIQFMIANIAGTLVLIDLPSYLEKKTEA